MIVNLDGDPNDYKTILRDFFVELKEYYTESIPSESKNEKVNEQLLIPAENNRLCFISCAASRTARLSSIIYPTLIRYGVTPVRLDDMIMPGDNWVLSLETLVQKSRAAIIDVSDGNPNIMFEFNAIISNPQLKEGTIIICEEKASIPIDVRDYHVLYYSLEDDSPDEVNNLFLERLEKWCIETYNLPSPADSKEDLITIIFKDAKRLYSKAEYSACILAAYSSLEEYARNLSQCNNTLFSSYLRNKVFPLIQTDKRLRRYLSKKDAYLPAAVHFIGGLQTNKVKYIIDSVDMIQSVDSLKLASEINRHAGRIGKIQDVLVEVNIGGEESKGGVSPEELSELIYAIAEFPNIKVKGLMAIPPAAGSEKFLCRMQELYIDISEKRIDNINMSFLSMGMSGDYELAVRYGSNIVRIGSALFGARVYR